MDEIEFEFDGHTYLVDRYSFGSSQPRPGGKASGRPTIIPITIWVEHKQDQHLAKWAWDPRKKYTATLNFIKGGTAVEQLQIHDAIAVGYEQEGNFESSEDGNSGVIIEKITLVSPKLNYNDQAKIEIHKAKKVA